MRYDRELRSTLGLKTPDLPRSLRLMVPALQGLLEPPGRALGLQGLFLYRADRSVSKVYTPFTVRFTFGPSHLRLRTLSFERRGVGEWDVHEECPVCHHPFSMLVGEAERMSHENTWAYMVAKLRDRKDSCCIRYPSFTGSSHWSTLETYRPGRDSLRLVLAAFLTDPKREPLKEELDLSLLAEKIAFTLSYFPEPDGWASK